MVLTVAVLTQPADVKRLAVVVVVHLDMLGTADFAVLLL
jgi:hypothetical protein